MKAKFTADRDGNLRYWIDDIEVTKEEWEKAFPPHDFTSSAPLAHFPQLHSEALAVHPLDIPEAVASARAKGIPTNFDAHGRPIFTSRGHRKRYLKAYGFHDRNGGYGD